ncbi:Unknown protein, partial [Striga hermonthica]
PFFNTPSPNHPNLKTQPTIHFQNPIHQPSYLSTAQPTFLLPKLPESQPNHQRDALSAPAAGNTQLVSVGHLPYVGANTVTTTRVAHLTKNLLGAWPELMSKTENLGPRPNPPSPSNHLARANPLAAGFSVSDVLY